MISVSSLNQQVEGFVKELAEETDAVRQSEAFKAYLDAAARFWQYSFSNQVLILVQNPKATRVAGFRTWNELGRRIKKGEKAIRILAPSIKKLKKTDEKTGREEEEKLIKGFVAVSVFDVGQTDGQPLPSIDVDVQGDEHKLFLDRLLAYCASLGITVETRALGVNGLYGYSKGGKIVLDSTQSVNSQACTLVHELAHELLHQTAEGKAKAFTKQEQELQAESVAYVVCKAAGLTPKSANYLAVYRADKERIMANLHVISNTSKKVLKFFDL